MTTAGAGDASGADLALLAHGAAQRAEVLVVDDIHLVAAELTRLALAASCRSSLVTPAGRPATLLRHRLLSHLHGCTFAGHEPRESSEGTPASRSQNGMSSS